MTVAQKKRLRRRRKFQRNVKKTILNILLAPARMPKISGSMLDTVMHMSEILGIVLATTLVMHLFNPGLIGVAIVVIAAIAFVGCLLTVKLGDYQDQLEEMKYYGFNI